MAKLATYSNSRAFEAFFSNLIGCFEFTCQMIDRSYQLSDHGASSPQIRVRNGKLCFLFLNQNISGGYSKEPSR